ncbi:MAG: hypothetical protein QM811_26695 [Pirellulales bacterium]
MAFDAASGLRLWQTEQADDVVHLLGVVDDCLIANGRNVRWIETATGRSKRCFPDVDDLNQGPYAPRGRGLLAGDAVYWPQAGRIAVLSQRVSTDPRVPIERNAIPFAPLAMELTGGNLYADGDCLYVATSDRIWALGPAAPLRVREKLEVAGRTR